jgi:hypothetical protein
MQNQIVGVSSVNLSEIVNGKNSFSKETMSLYREEIKLLRAEKKTRLAELDIAGITVIVAKAQSLGFVLSDTKERQGKRVDKLTLEFTRKSSQTELERLDAELEKMLARKAVLTAIAA